MFDYQPPADLLIHRFKAQSQFALAPGLAAMLARAVQQRPGSWPHDVVLVPVPASRQSLVRRGFNPAAEVARGLSDHLGWPCRPELLIRVAQGSKQALLNREQRDMATAGLYRTTGPVGHTVAIVDDVMTTGSTFNSIARILRRSGAVNVYALVLARTPQPDQPVQ